MRIVIDLQGSQTESRFRGIGRYSLALTQAIIRQAGEHEIWLILNAELAESISHIQLALEGLIPKQRIRVFDVPAPVAENSPGNAWRTRAAEKIREHFILQMQPDVVLVTSLFEGYLDDAVTSVGAFSGDTKTAVILYDLIPLLNPAAYLPAPELKQYYQGKIESLKNADLLLAISDYSRLEAIEALGFKPDSIVNISTGADAQFKPERRSPQEIATLRQRLGITRNMVLYVPGGSDSRKNIGGLIIAYSLLSAELRNDHQLVIVSKLDEAESRQLERVGDYAGLAVHELVLTGYVEDEELISLYTEATLFVFPSKHEGFGLPVLEAMACGAPVIGSNSTSLPEVIGLAEALFDPLSPQSIMEKMAQALSDESFRQRLRAHGQAQAKKFSWDECAKRALSALEAFELSCRGDRPVARALGASSAAIVSAIADMGGTEVPSDTDLVRVADCIAFNMGRETPKQLMLDISDLVQSDARSGIQRVIRSILRELLENPPANTDVRPIYFDGVHYRYANAFAASLSVGAALAAMDAEIAAKAAPTDTDDIVDFCQDDIYLALDLNIYLTPSARDLYMRLQNQGLQLYFIVYDILLLQRPDWWPEGVNVAFEAWLRSLSEVATGLICISEAVAEEVRCWLIDNPPARIAEPTVDSFHLGADIENSLPTEGMPNSAAVVLEQMTAKSSFLMVGTVEPRKGHAQTLAAFELLWQQGLDINLVIVGKHGWLVDQLADRLLRHPELNQRLFWLEGISDEYLQQVYAAGACLIAASEGEGFGLPLIEAAQYRLPIIARDIPVFREVAGEHAYYFSGLESQVLADAVRHWLELNAEGLAPQSVGMPWLTWQESTRQLIERITHPLTTRKE
ncbi:MAG: glycosyltransferase family 1 protein [Methylobacter sp.]|nr:glycosyltransferase family 1 protein [Methylobacter sp.]